MPRTKKAAPEVEVTEEVKETKPAAKKTTKKSKKEEKVVRVGKPTVSDFDVIVKPYITEKTMAQMQNENKVTVIVRKTASKETIKDAFERVFQVKVTSVRVSNYSPKEKSRGGRYKGSVPGYKKAIVTLAEGEALDLFKE